MAYYKNGGIKGVTCLNSRAIRILYPFFEACFPTIMQRIWVKLGRHLEQVVSARLYFDMLDGTIAETFKQLLLPHNKA